MRRFAAILVLLALAQSGAQADSRTSFATYVRSGVGKVCWTGVGLGRTSVEAFDQEFNIPAGVFVGDGQVCATIADDVVEISVDDVHTPIAGGAYEFRSEDGELLATERFCGSTPPVAAPPAAVFLIVALDDSCGPVVAGTVRFDWT